MIAGAEWVHARRLAEMGEGRVVWVVVGPRLARRASRYYANLVKLRAGQTVLQTLRYRIKIITMKGLGARRSIGRRRCIISSTTA